MLSVGCWYCFDLSKVIRERRAFLGLSLPDLAAVLRCKYQVVEPDIVAAWETGSEVPIECIRPLAVALGLDQDILMWRALQRRYPYSWQELEQKIMHRMSVISEKERQTNTFDSAHTYSIVCPQCSRRSFNLNDVAHSWCDACKLFYNRPTLAAL